MLRFNPFKPGKIVHSGMFAGRVDELKALETALFQTQNGNAEHFLIHGERGIGKSSLLMVVENYAKGELATIGHKIYNFLAICIELEPNDTYQEIIRKVARELQRQLDNNQILKKRLKDAWQFITNWEVLGVKYNRETTPPDAMLEELADKFATVAKTMAQDNGGIFLFIDEADKPPTDAGLGEFVKFFTERLTKRGADNVGVGIVGITGVIKKMRDSHESSVRILSHIRLSVLEQDERKEVVRLGLDEAENKNGFRVDIAEDALDLISSLSEGYPHFIQQYAYSAFTEDSDNNIDIMDVIKGLTKENGALQQLGMRYFENMYTDEVRSDDYRTVLQVIAHHTPSYVQRKTIIEESGLKRHTVDNALAALKKRGSVIAKSGQKGQYRLPSRSFATWISAFKISSEKKKTEQGH
jgi:ABC-type dipeptide/oligopeptide/nickel transport system ATPase subunit